MIIKRLFTFTALVFVLMGSHIYAARLMLATIQFPQSVEKIPTLRIYCGGRIIPCSVDQQNKTVSFSIQKYSQQYHFNLLITEKITFALSASKYQSAANNTASYITIPEHQPYKFFSCDLMPNVTETKQMRYQWHIKRESLHYNNLKVPDDAIIVCYNPDWIDGIQGKNAFEIPTITIIPDLLEKCGSEKSFYDKSTQMMLTALDSDTMHALHSPLYIKHEEHRMTIAAPPVA